MWSSSSARCRRGPQCRDSGIWVELKPIPLFIKTTASLIISRVTKVVGLVVVRDGAPAAHGISSILKLCQIVSHGNVVFTDEQLHILCFTTAQFTLPTAKKSCTLYVKMP